MRNRLLTDSYRHARSAQSRPHSHVERPLRRRNSWGRKRSRFRRSLAAICGTSWGTCHMKYPLRRIDSLCPLLDRPSNSLTFDHWRPRRGASSSELYTQGPSRLACHQRIEGLSVSGCQWHYMMTKSDDRMSFTRLKSRLKISCTV